MTVTGRSSSRPRTSARRKCCGHSIRHAFGCRIRFHREPTLVGKIRFLGMSGILPDLTDEWASDASEFDTLAELRADVEKRVSSVKQVQAQYSFRENVLDALTQHVTIETYGCSIAATNGVLHAYPLPKWRNELITLTS